MARLIFAIVCAAVIAVSSLLHDYGVAFVAGIVAGALLFLYGVARGGAVGSASGGFQKRPADVSTRIGIALAAAGIGAASISHNPPFPLSFRIFYGVCIGIGCIGAVFLAARSMRVVEKSK